MLYCEAITISLVSAHWPSSSCLHLAEIALSLSTNENVQ